MTKDENIWNVPLPSSKEKIQDKNCDMQFVSALMLVSKHKTNDGERYIYRNGLDKEVIAKMINKSERTIDRKLIQTLKTNSEFKTITAENTSNGLVYKLHYAKKVEDEITKRNSMREYVVVESDMLEKLVNVTNSNVIKTYILLKYHLAKGKKTMSLDFIAEQIGLASKSGNNRKRVADYLDALAMMHYIKKHKKVECNMFWDEKLQEQRMVTIVTYEYELCTYEHWLENVKNLK